MSCVVARTVGALVLLAAPATSVAQDVARDSMPLPLDTTRLRPWRRAYEMVAHAGDSLHVIGRRMVTFAPAPYAGAPAWLLLEYRDGTVAAVESLYVTPTIRPLHWASTLGAARLAVEFGRDSIFGATSSPAGKQNIVLAGSPDLIVSTAMVEALLPLMALTAHWADTVSVLTVDHSATTLAPAELIVVGEDQVVVPTVAAVAMADSVATRDAWIVALRAPARSVLFWVDKHSGELLRLLQPLPLHGANLMEYRRVRDAGAGSGASGMARP